MHDPVERFFTVPAGPLRAKLFELLIRVLTAAVTVVGPAWRSTRAHAEFVADQVRCRTAGDRPARSRVASLHVVDPVDLQHATAVREIPASREPLDPEAMDAVLTRVIALGRPDALAVPSHGAWANGRPEELYVDDRRMAAALRLLDDEGIELVRRPA